ncbi:uncharacterized protein SPAPADRAFT_54072 [Spathaspora passalidarum NRRL Y-27907]|uniref:Brix domain-containing protein n=1 Tax=Spathaspora passalidarum (strain NRRL Y-27907 / 11-Y1) TaxID=619300 RepID=G3AIX4_SPAPN|nr:uncharacterized protein SPAPADRAFT_54072 [Spathaspora passalidarum NRRL Y-27907]EGW33785.1 hypothetical protein SPAPADRAFT_54072 [Spathaspora passalidarum NRRL Y-27907]
MAKRRQKTRTHKKVSEEELAKIPRSMVLHLGASLKNHSLTQLVRDFRNVMQPHTAINLRERKSNRLKDFIVMAGPLGVSDLFIFNQSESTGNISLRMGKMPRGPTLQFKINSYSLVKDVRKILKHPKSVGKDSKEFLTPPLLVLNGFSSQINDVEHHEKLMITMFQNMFPPIQPQSTKVSTIKRVLMISKDPQTQEIEIRHYAINTKLVEENRNVKKLINSHHNLKKHLPNLAKNSDVSDLLLDQYSVGGMTSDSEVEDDAIVEIKQEEAANVVKKKEATAAAASVPKEETTTKKRAIKLTELGPRINMSLVKIEEGLIGSSKTLYHATITKSELEQKELAKKHELKQKLKAGEQVEENQSEEDKDMSESDSDAPEINPEDYENDSDLYSDVEV